MTSIAHPSVRIQTSSCLSPVPPPWFGEVALLIQHLRKQGTLDAINEQVRFARRRFGQFEVLDFVAVLFGYAISGERTLQAFYERVRPWATAFMALFARDRLPSRSALSRWLAALTAESVEALRACFLADLLARPLGKADQPSGLWDRTGKAWLVFDVDGTREAARQRALPQTPDRPVAQRRLRPLCAPGYLGRKRGEVVRTRTTALPAHTHQWLGTFGNAGNGEYRAELRRAVAAIHAYLKAHQVPPGQAIMRLDGQYGTGAVLSDLADLAYVRRGQDYHLLEREEVQTRLHLPPDQQVTHPESGIVRALYDCPGVPIGAKGAPCRVVVATHPATDKKSRIGVTRAGKVYELFLTGLPQGAFTAADVVALSSRIVARLKTRSPMKIRSKIQIVGVVTPPTARSAGRSSANGCGIFGWNWGITSSRSRHAPPSLRQRPGRGKSQHLTSLPLCRAMHRQSQASPGNTAASPGETLLFSPMGRCVARLGRRLLRPNSAEKPMARCACSLPPRFVTVVPVGCATSVRGREQPPRSRAG